MIKTQGEDHMPFSDEEYQAIGTFVQQNLPQWFATMPYPRAWHDRDMELRERAIRVEEQLNTQRELMQQGFDLMEKRINEHREEMIWRFDQVDKRFEQVDKRFEQIDKRFEQVDKRLEQIDKRFDQVDKRFEQNDKRFETTDKRIEDLRSDMNRRFTLMFIFMGTGFTLLSVMMSLYKFLGP